MKTVLPIKIYPDQILRIATKSLAKSEIKSYTNLAEEMDSTMETQSGVGLAAVQVGQSVRLAVINKQVSGGSSNLWLFNPQIIWRSDSTRSDEEGCLSLPGVFGLVKRPSSIIVKYNDSQGLEHELKARGMLARVIQHEVDHLDGILFIDRAVKISEGHKYLEDWDKESSKKII